MPISPLILKRRYTEIGRIRLGNKVATNNGGSRPNKLTKFRFTSASEQHIRDLAALYGGEPRPWDNNGKPEWEVFSDAQVIPVVVLKNGMTQDMETWSGGGKTHWCDGEKDHNTGQPCDPADPAHVAAKPYTRIGMILPELASVGSWRLETKGWNAAAELPAIAELAQLVGDMVPAFLHLQERRVVKDGQTSRFVVPILDLRIGPDRLKEIVAEKSGTALPAGQAPALAGGTAPAIEAGRPDYLAQAQQCSTFAAVVAIRTKAGENGHLTEQLDAELAQVATALRNAEQTAAAPSTGQPDADGVVDAEVVDEGAAAAADFAWQKVLKVAGLAGLTLDETSGEFSAYMQGKLPADGTAEDFDAFAEYLANGHDVQVPA